MFGKERELGRELQPAESYVRSARYIEDADALVAYTQAQETIFSSEVDLSAYRIRYLDIPYVVVLGKTPPQEFVEKIDELLMKGESTVLPPDIITTLTERRSQARRLGPWLEGHYRPGLKNLNEPFHPNLS